MSRQSYSDRPSIPTKTKNDSYDNQLRNAKNIVQQNYGIHKKPLNQILNESYDITQIPSNHSLNQDAMQRFLDKCDSDVRDICKILLDNTDHISFESFILRLNESIYHLIGLHILVNNYNPKNDLCIYLKNIRGIDIKTKSNYWIYLYVEKFISNITNNNLKLNLIDSLDDPRVAHNDMIVIIDDCIYSGEQIERIIHVMTNRNNKQINLYILASYITYIGQNRIINEFSKKFHKNNSQIFFPANVYVPNLTQSVLNTQQIEKINSYYDYITTFENKSLIYFDHKLADTASTITPFYLGIVATERNKQIIEKKINDKIYKGVLIVHPKLYNSLEIIPFINHCQFYTRDINMDSPICPSTPYKTSSHEAFINYIKSTKSVNKSASLSRNTRTLKSYSKRNSA